jgi:hypothetical protein
MPKPKSHILDTNETLTKVLTSIVAEMAKELLATNALNGPTFKAALEHIRLDVSTRSDLDYVAAKQLLKTFLLLADPNYQEP